MPQPSSCRQTHVSWGTHAGQVAVGRMQRGKRTRRQCALTSRARGNGRGNVPCRQRRFDDASGRRSALAGKQMSRREQMGSREADGCRVSTTCRTIWQHAYKGPSYDLCAIVTNWFRVCRDFAQGQDIKHVLTRRCISTPTYWRKPWQLSSSTSHADPAARTMLS